MVFAIIKRNYLRFCVAILMAGLMLASSVTLTGCKTTGTTTKSDAKILKDSPFGDGSGSDAGGDFD